MFEARYGWTIWMVMVPLLGLAAGWDYRRHRIPNWLNLSLALSGLAVQETFGGGEGLARGVTGLLAGLALLSVPWAMGLLGAGDVKLLGAIGAWLGPRLVWESLVAGAILGGLAGLTMILIAGRAGPAWESLSFFMIKCRDRELVFSEAGAIRHMGPQAQLLPYGVPLALGTGLVLVFRVAGGWGG